MTGFALVKHSSDTYATSTQLTGKAWASDYAKPTPGKMTTAIGDMMTAYIDAALRPTTVLDYMAGRISGKTLFPGVYSWGSDISFTTDIYIDGSATDVFIFQTTNNLVVGSGAKVILQGGALASNIVWQVAGHVEVGTTAHLEGTILVKTKAAFKTGSSLNGRILAQTAVTLDAATITKTDISPISDTYVPTAAPTEAPTA
jgi:hypothetical protein